LEKCHHQKKSGTGHDLAAGAMQTQKKGGSKTKTGEQMGEQIDIVKT
jgi:hypothetical protein